MVTLTGTSPYLAKDQIKANTATKFIGQGSPRSSTNRYRQDFGQLANTGAYTSEDRVFVSVEGNRAGRLDPPWQELDLAVEAGVTFITDNQYARNRSYNIGERQVAKYLSQLGYIDNMGIWTKE